MLFDDTVGTTSLSGGGGRLLAGTNYPVSLHEALEQNQYTTALLLYLFGPLAGDADLSGLILNLMDYNKKMHGVSVFTDSGGGAYSSTDGGRTFQPRNQGLPGNPRVSALAGTRQDNIITWWAGSLGNQPGEGSVYRSSIPVSVVDEQNNRPASFALLQNYPNPFNPATRIPFTIQVSGFISLKVYDVLGREVATLVNGNLQAGSYEITFNADGLASGVYLYRLQAGKFVQTRKLVLVN